MDDAHYYRSFALAYLRGQYPELCPLPQDAQLAAAPARGARLHRFKRSAQLPRVRKVLGALKSYAPNSLLDVGSGRGVFLWPLLDELPAVRVTAMDRLRGRTDVLEAVRRGGVDRLTVHCGDAAKLPWERDSFEVVTALEVLEHVEAPHPVASEALRVASVAVIISVPAKPDDNPEHLRLFTPETLTQLVFDAGARSVRIEHVLNHLVAFAKP